jgi:signal transduction histidine kinase
VTAADDLPIRSLLEVARALVSGLDTRTILDRVLEAARDVTGARYAALGVLDEERGELAQFLTVGVDQATYRAIGEVPRGQGVLGVLIADPRPLRLSDVAEHPRSFGFPDGHPRMRTFLGVPVMIRGEAWGNLYLTEKQGGGEFTEADEHAAVILAEWAGAAINNARLYENSERRREQLESAVRELEATRDIAVAVGAVTGLERVLELIAKRGRALIDARAVLIMLRDGAELVVAASAGYAANVDGRRLPISGSTSGNVLERGRPERIADVASRLRIAAKDLGVPDARTALLVPMLHRGGVVGVLAAFDRGEERASFTEADEQLLQTFAASAANAVAIARSVEADRLRSSMAAADAERVRWARELHDETLQIFGGLRVLLSGSLRRADPTRFEAAMREAIVAVEQGIEALRAIIADLRPAALDEIGLKPAIQTLLERRGHDRLEIVARLELPDPRVGERALDPELETTVYRLVQEALTNTAKHADATTVQVEVIVSDGQVTVEVRDNGAGFDVSVITEGFGLAGMRERVYLAGGTLEIESSKEGTLLRATLPARYADRTSNPSGRGHAVS